MADMNGGYMTSRELARIRAQVRTNNVPAISIANRNWQNRVVPTGKRTVPTKLQPRRLSDEEKARTIHVLTYAGADQVLKTTKTPSGSTVTNVATPEGEIAVVSDSQGEVKAIAKKRDNLLPIAIAAGAALLLLRG